jgi:DNA polymerase kappa
LRADEQLLPQICSDRNKPNGQFELTFEGAEIRKFMRDLPIRTIPGIGRVHERVLKSMGVDVSLHCEVSPDGGT